MAMLRDLTCFFMLMVFSSLSVQAGVIIGGTRLIYDGSKKEATLNLSNPDDTPYLMQSWVEPAKQGDKSPFLITPPLFRLDGGSQNLLRVILKDTSLPEDRESLYWMSIKSIPSSKKDDDRNTLQLAIKTRIKLIYRPASLQDKTPLMVANKLNWKIKGDYLVVTNTTPYYMNFIDVKVGGEDVTDANVAAPKAETTFKLTSKHKLGDQVTWKVINDYGGLSDEYIYCLKK
ncbi:molecular chaperone [Aeromonas salmonicida]|uniref:fimbrial biogenesis chaperone n=1 Tax=Aeromonas salmonicida TaxID=645 RepID=UPI002796A234|nr:molecular chaperone [Aeromonas salmonicida]MDQ1884169.1 molecular chaperone [Aeromonas salmonicida]